VHPLMAWPWEPAWVPRFHKWTAEKMGDKNRGSELIAQERKRQIENEGWTSEHDDSHDCGELVAAANCYRIIGNGSHGESHADADQSTASIPIGWPWGIGGWKPKTRMRNLVRAGALYEAEIDRLTRVREAVIDEIDQLSI